MLTLITLNGIFVGQCWSCATALQVNTLVQLVNLMC